MWQLKLVSMEICMSFGMSHASPCTSQVAAVNLHCTNLPGIATARPRQTRRGVLCLHPGPARATRLSGVFSIVIQAWPSNHLRSTPLWAERIGLRSGIDDITKTVIIVIFTRCSKQDNYYLEV